MNETKQVETAEAELERARGEAAAARRQLEGERAGLRNLEFELAMLERSDKAFPKKAAAKEEARVYIEALETRIGMADEKVAQAERALEVVRAAEERAELETARRRVEQLRRQLAEDGKQLEALVVSTRSSLLARVKAHRAILEELNSVAETVFKADHPDDPYAFFEARESSAWALEGKAIDARADGLLGALEHVIDWREQVKRENARPPPPDLDAPARERERQRILELFQENEAEKARRAEYRARQAERQTYPVDVGVEVVKAINAKVDRDNPVRTNREDFTPRVG